ncbi:ubiquinone biosynthesis protein Coq4 [Phlyctochytrium arcticum]|nr:ubiquinone biosynthesis protein Coq4 [Phlyctochytrium arcticum]
MSAANPHTSHSPRYDPGPIERTCVAVSSAFGAIIDPTRQETVAYLGETTGPIFLRRARDHMLKDQTGRRILRERPNISSHSMDLDRLRKLPDRTFGREYVRFLDGEGVSPDTRTPVKYIANDELAYVMLRYRQVHDFWHTLTGLPTTIEAELALKWFEMIQTGFPVAALSAFVGGVRLSSAERDHLFQVWVPWAVQCAGSCKYLLNIYYEEHLDRPLLEVQKDLGFIPLPKETSAGIV